MGLLSSIGKVISTGIKYLDPVSASVASAGMKVISPAASPGVSILNTIGSTVASVATKAVSAVKSLVSKVPEPVTKKVVTAVGSAALVGTAVKLVSPKTKASTVAKEAAALRLSPVGAVVGIVSKELDRQKEVFTSGNASTTNKVITGLADAALGGAALYGASSLIGGSEKELDDKMYANSPESINLQDYFGKDSGVQPITITIGTGDIVKGAEPSTSSPQLGVSAPASTPLPVGLGTPLPTGTTVTTKKKKKAKKKKAKKKKAKKKKAKKKKAKKKKAKKKKAKKKKAKKKKTKKKKKK